jgi:hypothetical protein
VFVVKLPARVYCAFVPAGMPVAGEVTTACATAKKPSPWIATSSGLPVDCRAPPVIMLSIEPRPTPRPTWAAFVPPLAPEEPDAPRCSWVRESLNVVRADL